MVIIKCLSYANTQKLSPYLKITISNLMTLGSMLTTPGSQRIYPCTRKLRQLFIPVRYHLLMIARSHHVIISQVMKNIIRSHGIRSPQTVIQRSYLMNGARLMIVIILPMINRRLKMQHQKTAKAEMATLCQSSIGMRRINSVH